MQRLFARRQPPLTAFEVRAVTSADRAALTRLTERSRRAHFHLDWWSLDDWLNQSRADGCLVARHRNQLAGVIVAPPQDTPITWVRLFAVADDYAAEAVFSALLPPVLAALRAVNVQALACLAHPDWLARLLPGAGFAPRVEVANFVKESRDIPDYGWAGAEVRPAALDDLSAVLPNDRAAFDPVWWHTLDSLQRALRDMAHFVVAEVDGRSVGHAFSDLYGRQGHLVRLAVHPDVQGRGIGTRLLAESLEYLIAKCSAWPLTLNTQTDNYTSQSLYRRFGFAPTGDSTMVMIRET